jgi:PAS domain S-box-containing protein
MITTKTSTPKSKPAVALPPVRIMIIDDDEDEFMILSNYIKNIQGRSFLVDCSSDHEAALEDMRQNRHDLYFIDYKLGAKTGLEILQEAVSTTCIEPIIMLTGMGSRDLDIAALSAGATDYLNKSELTTDKLERSIRYAIERASSLKSLRQNEQKFRAIFEKSKDAVFIADSELFFKEVNQGLANLLGYSKNKILSLSVYDLIIDKEKKESLEKQLSDDTEVFDVELELSGFKGKKIECLLSLSIFKDDKGQPYIQGIIHDITALRRAERSHLQSEKLKAANRLFRIIAHEVRNPLTNINISLDMLEVEQEKDSAKSYMDIIRRNSGRINELIMELLDSSREKELSFQKISIQDIFDQTLAMASDRIILKNIQVNAVYPAEEAMVNADPEKIKIAVLNIIINAIEAISHDHGQLNIKIENLKKAYEVSIEDNGTGISEEHLSRLFEPFFTSKRNGLGLGLASTFAILQSHSITVDVKTKLGKGTCFMLSFPK